MSEHLDKAKESIHLVLRPHLDMSPNCALLDDVVLQALPHLEAHFREVMAQRLEAAATIKRRDGGACFKFAAAFLRESDR